MIHLLAVLCALSPAAPAHRVLIVADEMPAMRVLAERLAALEAVDSQIVAQSEMPADLRVYSAVIVYIHGNLDDQAESRLLEYADDGGKLILLHHSISSGKRRNRFWLPRIGVELRQGDAASGGYKWIEGVRLGLVNLAPRHFITRNKVTYAERLEFAGDGHRRAVRPGFTLGHSEVYLNHHLSGQRTILLGLVYNDPHTGVTWMQGTAGWVMPLGKGRVVYLMPGHSPEEFQHPAYGRLIANAVIWKP